MDIKLIDLINAQPALAQIIYQLPSQPGDTAPQPRRFKRAQLARRVGNLARQMEPHLKQYDELRVELCKQYGTLSADGAQWTIKPESVEVFTTEFAALGDDTIQLDHHPIPVAWLDVEGVELSAFDAQLLVSLVQDEADA